MDTQLTDQQIDNLVAETVFGYTVESGVTDYDGMQMAWTVYRTPAGPSINPLPYSTNMVAAWAVVLAMVERGSDFSLEQATLRGQKIWVVSYSYVSRPAPVGMAMEPDSIPRAICRAALTALGVEV